LARIFTAFWLKIRTNKQHSLLHNFIKEKIMNYIDGYVIPVATEKRDAYFKQAEFAAAIFKEYGALRVVECWGNDVPPGKLTSFPKAVICEPHEEVVFSWVEWPSKQIRDEGMKKFMADSRLDSMDMPFDGKRLIFGGFQAVLDV
jgi:uncharacterized protein YbaA (DUF1428 family)